MYQGVLRNPLILSVLGETVEGARGCVEDQPVRLGDPILEEQEAGWADGHVHGAVVVAEQEDVHRRLAGSGAPAIEGRAELVQRLLLPFEDIADALAQAGAARPAVAQPVGEPGVQGAEARLQEAVVEDALWKMPRRIR